MFLLQEQQPFFTRALCLGSDGALFVVTNHGHVAVLAASKADGLSMQTPLLPLLPNEQSNNLPLDVSNGFSCDDNNNLYIVSNRYGSFISSLTGCNAVIL